MNFPNFENCETLNCWSPNLLIYEGLKTYNKLIINIVLDIGRN
jgi:hypothetical protein